MSNIKKIYKNSTQYDLLNKFNYKNTKKLPKINRVIVNFWCKTTDIKSISTSLLALELITQRSGILTTSKKPNLFVKLKKGDPVGCKVVLRHNNLFNFLNKIINDILPQLKNFKGVNINSKNRNELSFNLSETLNFSELEKNYYLFNNLTNLNITIVANSTNLQELKFLTNSLKITL